MELVRQRHTLNASANIHGDDEQLNESLVANDKELQKFITSNNDNDEAMTMTKPQKSQSSSSSPMISSAIIRSCKGISLILLILLISIFIIYPGGVLIRAQITSIFIKKIVNQKLKEWKNAIPDLVSNLTISPELPTYKRPFIFFHPRKTGGSSMRTHIYREAKRNCIQNSTWISCFNAKCVPYSLPPPTDSSVIFAGHLNFMHMTQIMRETRLQQSLMSSMKQPSTLEDGSNVNYHKLDDSYPLFDCVTFLRPTVSRVVSCWNYRMVDEMEGDYKMPRSNNLTPQDWENLLPYAMDKYNNGCNNEFARIFGSTVHESQVNSLSTSKPFFLEEFDNIASRISKCVILRIDQCEHSDVIMHHYIPWMNETTLCSVHANRHRRDSDAVSEESAAVILEQNYMDELIFQFASDVFDQQFEIAFSAL